MTTQTNTVKVNPVSLVVALYSAIDTHQNLVDQLNPSYTARTNALLALKSAGFTSVQDGRSKGPAKANEVPFNKELKDFFTARFEASYKTTQVAMNESLILSGKDAAPIAEPSKAQLENNLKNQVRVLNSYLKTGIFATNVGREKTKNELQELTAALNAAEKKEQDAIAKAAKDKAALVAASAKQAADKLEAEQDAAESEAERLLIAEVAKMAQEAAAKNPTPETKAQADKAQADKAQADKAQADKVSAAKIAADKAAADKENAAKQAAAAKIAADKASAEKQAAAAALAAKKNKGVTVTPSSKINFNARFSSEVEDQAKAFIANNMAGVSIPVLVCIGRLLLATHETAE
jgi:hypothetical protein